MAATWAPTPAAPTVCAMVLSVRMAASGVSMSCLRALTCLNHFGFFSSSWAIKLGVMDNNAASMTEHKKEIPMAVDAKNIKRNIML